MATKRLNSTRRQKRVLTIPEPGRPGNIKVTLEGWINCAKVALIEEGISGVKADRLAKRLNVTRGGFYYHFSSFHKLLEALIQDWRLNNRFTPANVDTSTPKLTLKGFKEMTQNLLHDSGFDPQYDMAIREWARISQPVADIVHLVDEERIDAIKTLFLGFGYKPNEALIRARVFYWHQMGYYSIGVHESLKDRENNVETYLEVLGGDKYMAALKASK